MAITLSEILGATTVASVIDLQEAMERPAWKPVGQRENNLATINLSSDPAAGLVERITNAIDAVLDREWSARGRPTNVGSPRAAVEEWFGIARGRLETLSGNDLRRSDIVDLTDRIEVTFRDSEKPDQPTVDVRDLGIGLLADEFASTILSLNQSMKLKKFFLAGAFGQGGSTALAHSPHTLIVSRRATPPDAPPAPVAFTIIRFNPGNLQTDKHGVYEYLVDHGNGHPLVLTGVPVGDFPAGTLVRHVQMDLARYSKPLTVATGSPWYMVHNYLFDPVVPFRLVDKRENATKDARRTVAGNHRLLTRGGGDGSEEEGKVEYQSEARRTFRSGEVALTWWVLGVDGKNPRERIKHYCLPSKPIIITYNGQKQGELPNTVIKDDLKLPYLERYLIVHVDCDLLDPESRRQLFPTTRESLRDNSVVDELRQLVTETLQADERLHELDRDRKARLMTRTDSASAENLRKRLANRIQTMIAAGGGKTPRTQEPKHPDSEGHRERPLIPIQEPPTLLEITTPAPRIVHPGRSFTIKFRTDADPNYFRSPDAFIAVITPAGLAQYTGTTTVNGGYGTTYFKVAEDLELETTGTITLELRPKRAKALDATIEVIAKTAPPVGGVEQGKAPTPNLNPHWVRQGEAFWEEHAWNHESVAEVVPTEDSVDIFVSADNRRLNALVSRAQRRGVEAVEAIKDFYLEHIAFHALLAQMVKSSSPGVVTAGPDDGEDAAKPEERELRRVCETVCGVIDAMFDLITTGAKSSGDG